MAEEAEMEGKANLEDVIFKELLETTKGEVDDEGRTFEDAINAEDSEQRGGSNFEKDSMFSPMMFGS